MFPNIHILLHLVCTLSVTSIECERSTSVLRRLKTYLRSTMGQERMTGLALMHIKYGMELNLDDINIFLGQHQRRMLFADILAKEVMLLYMLFFMLIFLRPNCDQFENPLISHLGGNMSQGKFCHLRQGNFTPPLSKSCVRA